jgi:hypothetical protein
MAAVQTGALAPDPDHQQQQQQHTDKLEKVEEEGRETRYM